MEKRPLSYFDSSLLREQRLDVVEGESRLLARRIFEISERAKSLGVETGVAIYRLSGEQLDSVIAEETQPVFAASINKLAIAHYYVYKNEDDQNFLISPDDVRVGEGLFDNRTHGTLEVSCKELIYDMLARSGNTAARALGKGHAKEINNHLLDRGYLSTGLTELEDGNFYLGETNPKEAAMMMADLLKAEGEGPVADEVLRALQESETPYFDRKFLDKFGPEPPELFCKYGKYNGDEDIPYAVRHEVGALRHISGEVQIYSVLSKYSRSKLMKLPLEFIAKTTIQQMRAEVLFGYDQRVAKVIKTIGRLAMRQ